MATYPVGKDLGAGTFGTVFATHGGGRPCAGKRDKDVTSPSSRIIKEGRRIWGLAPHPNIIVLFDIVPSENLLVMERGEQDLFAYCHSFVGGIPELIVRSLARQLFAGLAHCHRQNTVHCDVKPSNLILFEGATVLKIADFGESHHTSELPLAFTVCTRTHRAPEVFAGHDWGIPIDVWSAGVVLYEMLFDTYPFTSGSERNILIHIVKKLGLPAYLEGSKRLPTRAWDETGRMILDTVDDSPRKESLSMASKQVLNQTITLNPLTRLTAAEAEDLLCDH
jgi:serine/threonine protein kinase